MRSWTPDQLAAIEGAVATDPALYEVLDAAHRVDVPPAEVLAYLAASYDANVDDWVHDLLEWFDGDVDATQRAIVASGAPVDPYEVRREVVVERVRYLLATRAPLGAFEPWFAELGVAAAPFRRHLVRLLPLADVLAARERFPVHELRAALGEAYPAPDLADAVLAAVPADEAERWLVALLGERARDAATPAGRVRLRAAHHGRSLWELVPWAESVLPFPGWLGPLLDAGFTPTFAALACLERGLSVPAAAEALRERGVPVDLLLPAFWACAAGPVVEALHGAGWSAPTLVAMARASGRLDPEIRETLRGLRVPDGEIAALLAVGLTRR